MVSVGVGEPRGDVRSGRRNGLHLGNGCSEESELLK